jgi:hypothetical protein
MISICDGGNRHGGKTDLVGAFSMYLSMERTAADAEPDAPALAGGALASPVSAVEDPYQNPASLRFRFRQRRFRHMRRLIENALSEKDSIDILDLGGREVYWRIGEDLLERYRGRIRIHLVNCERMIVTDPAIFSFLAADATDPALLQGRQFDIVHSNSVIEHVGGWREIRAFAMNVERLAPRYFVQTPNFWFPYEPHFLVPGFQFLPIFVRAALVRRFSLGFYPRIPDWHEARVEVEAVRLLRRVDMSRLFPDAAIRQEWVLGLPKSIMAIKG